MRKTFCDICGKEIEGFANNYTVKIDSELSPNDYNRFFKDVCKSCANSIVIHINELKKERNNETVQDC